MEYILIFISAVFINNVVLSQILGICPFLGVSKKIDTAVGMGMAVTFVMAIATTATFLLMQYILIPLKIEFMQTLSFILVIAALVQMVEMVLKKVSPSLYQSLGIFLPLITVNCVVLGAAILVTQHDIYKNSLLLSVFYAIATAIGFALALVIFAGIREQLNLVNIPKALKGMPIALIVAGILAMVFMGFTGIV